MHDLQGGSSSSQKSRSAAIFWSPVFPRSRTGLFLSFRPRRAESPPSGEILYRTQKPFRTRHSCLPPRGKVSRSDRRGVFAPFLLSRVRAVSSPSAIPTSSSHAYAVSILPFSKTLDLQGGSSSSQKSRFAAIFGSPVIITRRVEKSCAVRIRRQAPLLRPRLPTTEKAGDEADE